MWLLRIVILLHYYDYYLHGFTQSRISEVKKSILPEIKKIIAEQVQKAVNKMNGKGDSAQTILQKITNRSHLFRVFL